jgi:hypothetical protein
MGIRSRTFALAAASCGLALTTQIATERAASACGGCFHEAPPVANPTQDVADITDERMLLSVSQNQTTLYDQIRYTGNPASFAWVLPIKGNVDIGLSADIMFDSIDALTATQITGPTLPSCPPPPFCPGSYYGDDDESGGGGGCSSSDDSSAFGADNASTESDSATSSGGGSGLGGDETPPVTVTKQDNVGPYETVQLHSTDPQALNKWLTQNGFVIPANVTPIIDAYVSEGFDFLAMRLLPNEGVQAMRPVRVTTQGASLQLPLRMAAIGTGATVGITIWVLAQGRYEPQNFPFFHIEDSQLTWDFSASSSDYATQRAQQEANFAGRGWEIESSVDIASSSISTAILTSGASVNAAATDPTTASDDYLPITISSDDDAGASSSDGGDAGDAGDASAPDASPDASIVESADDVRNQDIATLLEPSSPSTGIVRITRMRSDISHSAMTTDFYLQAATDQSELSNDRNVTKSTNAPVCPTYPACPATSTASATNGNSAGGSGCTTMPRRENSSGMILTFIGLFGLIFTRVIRVRRRK